MFFLSPSLENFQNQVGKKDRVLRVRSCDLQFFWLAFSKKRQCGEKSNELPNWAIK